MLTVPAGFEESVVATGLNGPTTMAVAPDGRVFVALQNGNVRVVKDGALLPTSFVNVREDSQEERGLLGLTFDPDFTNNHYVYVYYTKRDAAPLVAHNVVSRFVADGDVAAGGVNAAGEQVLFELPDVGGANWHMGGGLRFGPDGKLYVAVGDHQQPTSAQSLESPFGKILRINPDGSIPADNPFYDQTTGINRAIWALGLRNPFSASFQSGTGRFFINDVGGGRAEEIDEGTAGRNYGWPETEGAFSSAEFPDFTNPLHAYPRSVGMCVIGGAFYDGVADQFPQQYRGKYFFADFRKGWVRTLDPATYQIADFATSLPFPVAVTLAPDGTLWVLSHDATDGGTANAGVLRSVRYTPQPPPAAVTGTWVFYNNSVFDGRDRAATPDDDRAIAADKSPLAPGATGGFANITSYSRGINGVMVDIRGGRRDLTASDFDFKLGSGSTWANAPAPTSVTVRRGAGAAESDRFTLVWPDGAIRNAWLRVTVKANDNTGLAQPEVFSFGNLVGETGNTATAPRVTALDLVATRRSRSRSPAAVANAYDFNRDGRVNALDVATVKASASRTLSLAEPPASAATTFAGATSLLRDE